MTQRSLQSVIVYDGDCAFCRSQIARIRQRDTQLAFEYVPRQQPGLIDRFPALAQADFNTGMRLIEPDGTIHVGADAVYQMARRVPAWRIPAQLYRLPVFRGFCRLAYKWVARNRQRLGRTCHQGACAIHAPSASASESAGDPTESSSRTENAR